MDKILKDLYYGNLCPMEKYSSIIENYKQNEVYEHCEEFKKKLDFSLAKEFEDIIEQQLDNFPIELSDAFISGFRLGAKMMIETLATK